MSNNPQISGLQDNINESIIMPVNSAEPVRLCLHMTIQVRVYCSDSGYFKY